MTRNRLLALLGLLGSLALVWGASAAVMWSAAAAPAAARDAKFQSAERLVFFRLEPGEALTLPLPANADAFKLLTHVVLPKGTAYAAERQYVYGVQVRLLAEDGGEVLARPLFTRTRQSKAQRMEGLWLQESAFSVNPEVQVTDGREFLVDLSPGVRERARRVEVRHPGKEGSLLVRAYARFDGRPSLFARSSGRSAEARATRATFLPWDKVSPESRERLAEEHWERLSADGEAGIDYRTEPVYRSDFRLPLVEVQSAAQERLEPGRAVALNVRGPAALQLWVWGQEPLPAGAPSPAVSVHALGADGATRAWDVRVPPSLEPSSHLLELPAGAFTLTLHNAGRNLLHFTLEGPPATWLAPGELVSAREGLRVPYLPDVRRAEAWAAGPGCPALELDVADLGGTGRLLRLEARAIGEALARGADVTVTLLDAKGQPTRSARMALPQDPSPHDGVEAYRLRDGALPCAAAPAGERAEGRKAEGTGGSAAVAGASPAEAPVQLAEVSDRPLPVSQTASGRLFLPAGTSRVRISASHPAALQLSAFLPASEEALYAPPYGEVALAGVRWRAAPLDARHWHALRPLNHAALSGLGAQVTLSSQVRLEPEGVWGGGAPSGEPVKVVPAGTPASRELLEPVAQGPGDATRTEASLLTPGEPLRVSFPERSPSRPELRLALPGGEGLGGEVELVVDGQPVQKWVMRTTRARELLPPVAPGAHEVLVRSSIPGLTAALNRPPADERGLRPRTVYRLEGGGLRVPVRKPGLGAVTLNIVVYAPSAAATPAPRLAVRIDGGTPERRAGIFLPRLTRAERLAALPASERAGATSAARPSERWHARAIPVRLGEDLAPGLHWVEVQPLGEGEPLWARFFVYGEEPVEAGPLQWNRAGWEPEDGP
jgi:hypothetical protein